ncbi:hypothetical protein AcV7_000061 [Taiwanofungus camphoratus]|nr:hypothetical protein AcV7_000061 [Antrodia cinnamomea]
MSSSEHGHMTIWESLKKPIAQFISTVLAIATSVRPGCTLLPTTGFLRQIFSPYISAITITTSLTIDIFFGIYRHFFLLSLDTLIFEPRIERLREAVRISQESIFDLEQFLDKWIAFISTLGQQWMGILAMDALLSTVIVFLLQIDDLAGDPVTATLGFISLIDVLTSGTFCCVYLTHLSGLQSAQDGLRWLKDVEKIAASNWRDPCVLLAAPTAWLSWGTIALMLMIILHAWREPLLIDSSGLLDGRDSLGLDASRQSIPSIAPKIAITLMLAVAFLHLLISVATFVRLGQNGLPQVLLVNGGLLQSTGDGGVVRRRSTEVTVGASTDANGGGNQA